MLFLKAVTIDETTEYFNIQNILTIRPYGKNLANLRISMGTGLYWVVKADSIEVVSLENIIKN